MNSVAQLIAVERRLLDLAIQTANHVLPAHQAAEQMHSLAADIARLRRTMVESATVAGIPYNLRRN